MAGSSFWTTVFAIWTAVAIPAAALPVVRILIRAGKSVFIWAFTLNDPPLSDDVELVNGQWKRKSI